MRYSHLLSQRGVIAILFISLLCSCTGRVHISEQDSLAFNFDSLDFSHEVKFDYAKSIVVQNNGSYKEVVILDPNLKDTLATYLLYLRNSAPPKKKKETDIVLPVPVRRLACLSTPQVGTLPLLGASERLVGASALENINSPEIVKRIAQGQVQEIGRGMSKNTERILSIRPEVVMQDVTRLEPQDKELMGVGIIPVLFNSWKEQNLLGRAEWLKFSGLILGLNRRADSVFTQIKIDYLEARKLTQGITDTIPILYGLDYKGLWYIPGEYSYPTAMFRDAAVKYDYIPSERNSTPVSFEYVFDRHRHAKTWISVMTGKIYTKKDFLALNERYRYFDAAKEGGRIFLDRKRVNEHGGNEYWESGPYRPDLVLKDIIKITRPELLPEHELYYFIELL